MRLQLLTALLLLAVIMGGSLTSKKAIANKNRMRLKKSIAKRVKQEQLVRRSELVVGMLNMEGYKVRGMVDVGEAASARNMDVICLVETHLRKEDRKMIELEGYDTVEVRREDANDDMNGGGLAILTRKKSGLIFKQHKPKISNFDHAYVEKERMWVTYDSARGKTAICCLYLGFQASDDRHAKRNEGILKVLSEEIFSLRGGKYRICLQGDFNSWVGCDPVQGGIKGNHKAVNKNGKRFLAFLQENGLVHLNGACWVPGDEATRLAAGLWTRHSPDHRSSTVIDYAVVAAEYLGTVKSLEVDDKGILGGSSDHNFLVTRLQDQFEMNKKQPVKVVKKRGWALVEDVDMEPFRVLVQAGLASMGQDDGGGVSLAHRLDAILLKSLEEGVGRRPAPVAANKKVYPKVIVKLIKERKCLEMVWKTKKSAFASSSSQEPPDSLVIAAQNLQSKVAELEEALASFARQRRRPLMGRCKGKNKRDRQLFWSYVSRKTKTTTDIEAIQCKTSGKLKCKPQEIINEVYNYLKEIFSGIDPEERGQPENGFVFCPA
jgi:exonuclease III